MMILPKVPFTSVVITCCVAFTLVYAQEQINNNAVVVDQEQQPQPHPPPQPQASSTNLEHRQPSSLSPSSSLLMYPYTSNDLLKEINSMKQFHDQPLQFRLPFFGFAYHYIWIHKDGYVCFNRGLKSYKFPVSFPVVPDNTNLEEDPSLMAAFFAHQDIPGEVEESGVYFRIETVATLTDDHYRQRILTDFDTAMAGSGGFAPKFVLIITWKNMTFANRRPDRSLKTNTYQMVIGTDEVSTFVFYNYEWISWITHLDNFDGLNGPAAYIGFNAGNSTRAYEFLPYSQHPRVSLLPQIGFANNLEGRCVFQVHDVLFPGSCVDKSLDPTLPDRLGLTTSVNYISSLGGEMLEVTGPCFSEDSRISCRFDTILVKGHYKTKNVAICMTPQLMFEGYVDLIVTVDDKTFFYTRMYIQSPESRREFDVWVEEQEYVEKNPDTIDERDHVLTIKWKTKYQGGGAESQPVTISIWAYQEMTQSLYPRVTWLLDLVTGVPNTGVYKLDLNQLPFFYDLNRYDYYFGFIGVNSTGLEVTMTEWSRPMPLGWLLRRHYRIEYGKRWQLNFCQKWYERENHDEYFATSLFRCPCTLAQALLDKGRFAPDERCNVVDKKCDARHHGAQHCVRTARPSIGGSGQQCCYDDYGELIRSADTMYGGRPSRTFVYGVHPFKMQYMTPTLSYWQQDIMPFYHCCKWAPNEDDAYSCMLFNYFRTSQDCSNYQPVSIGSIFGDPHIITFDNLNYTFNGKGEYVLAQTSSPIHKLDIHGRFEQLPNLPATQLTAVAVRDNISSIVEFRIRPDGCRWFNQLFLIADKEYLYYWDDNMRTIHTRGVTIYQPSGIRNMSHLIAMFDSGAGVEVLVNGAGTLSLHVYLPNTYVNSTKGLLGYYSGDTQDDFLLPNGVPLSTTPSRLTLAQIHQQFGTKYRLLETPQSNLTQSLFFHDVVSHSTYDDFHFEPRLSYSPLDGGGSGGDSSLSAPADLYRICSDSLFCQYDYLLTQDSSYAENTKREEAIAQNMRTILHDTDTIRCPALDKPLNGRKSSNRYWPGTIVRFTCNEGYRLFGYEARRCREDGLWSWGVDVQCVEILTYTALTVGIMSIFFIPFCVATLAAVIVFRIHRRRVTKRKNFSHNGGGGGGGNDSHGGDDYNGDKTTTATTSSSNDGSEMESLQLRKYNSIRTSWTPPDGGGGSGATKLEIQPLVTTTTDTVEDVDTTGEGDDDDDKADHHRNHQHQPHQPQPQQHRTSLFAPLPLPSLSLSLPSTSLLSSTTTSPTSLPPLPTTTILYDTKRSRSSTGADSVLV